MIFPIFFAGVVGFSHAFEIDHLLAVGNIVTRRNSVQTALKDGVYWGLGHTSTILLIGILMLIARVAVSEQVFQWLEAGVGLMLILLGLHRLQKTWKHIPPTHTHPHPHTHTHTLAYTVGLVHGLAGSGALVLAVMTEMTSAWQGILYLVIFGVGSIAGMLLASSIFSLPFSTRIARYEWLYRGLTIASAALCIVFGIRIIMENMSS